MKIDVPEISLEIDEQTGSPRFVIHGKKRKLRLRWTCCNNTETNRRHRHRWKWRPGCVDGFRY